MKYLLLFILTVLTIAQSCTIQKRLYTKGWNVEWKNPLHKSDKSAPEIVEQSAYGNNKDFDSLTVEIKATEETDAHHNPDSENEKINLLENATHAPNIIKKECDKNLVLESVQVKHFHVKTRTNGTSKKIKDLNQGQISLILFSLTILSGFLSFLSMRSSFHNMANSFGFIAFIFSLFFFFIALVLIIMFFNSLNKTLNPEKQSEKRRENISKENDQNKDLSNEQIRLNKTKKTISLSVLGLGLVSIITLILIGFMS